jgi:thiamine biosynthesis protein ThiS
LRIEVNGERLEVSAPINLADLIRHLELAPERLAIELNRNVVRRADWQETSLNEGDRIEIVHFVGGGMKSLTRVTGDKFVNRES